MRHRAWLGALLITIVGMSLGQSSCDPQSAAMGLFASKGLNLLSPARDYVQPGGLVFLVKGGHPEYDDPVDKISPESGNLMNFKADIMQETQKRTAKFSAALSLAKTILPLSLSAGLQSDQNVSLQEISTTGVRLGTSALDDLIARPNTARAASDALSQGMQVFVVQEVYKASTLNLAADKTRGFDVKYENGSAVQQCGAAGDSAGKKNDSAGKANGATPPSAASQTAAASKKGSAKNSGGSSPEPANGASTLQAGLSVCLSDSYTLKMNAGEPIPFAVRMAELQLSGARVRRKIGAKTIRTSLGGGRQSEIAADTVSAQAPVLDGMTHRPALRP